MSFCWSFLYLGPIWWVQPFPIGFWSLCCSITVQGQGVRVLRNMFHPDTLFMCLTQFILSVFHWLQLFAVFSRLSEISFIIHFHKHIKYDSVSPFNCFSYFVILGPFIACSILFRFCSLLNALPCHIVDFYFRIYRE